jgi:predicted  nucleic acid-binding Zn-ribbon protein
VTIQAQIRQLEELSRIDEDLRRVEEELGTHRAGLQSLQTDLTDVDKRLGTDRESVTTMDRTRSELSVEVRQMNAQIEKSREKLARSRNERESLAAQREFEELRKLVRDREDEIERLGRVADKAREAITSAETKKTELQAELTGTTEGAKQRVATREEDKVRLVAAREIAAKALPPVLYRRYESIRQRRPRAIAQTTDGTCNGCHIAVPPMMFQKMLRQEELEQCPNCRRILYYVPAEAAGDAKASSSTAGGAEGTR